MGNLGSFLVHALLQHRSAFLLHKTPISLRLVMVRRPLGLRTRSHFPHVSPCSAFNPYLPLRTEIEEGLRCGWWGGHRIKHLSLTPILTIFSCLVLGRGDNHPRLHREKGKDGQPVVSLQSGQNAGRKQRKPAMTWQGSQWELSTPSTSLAGSWLRTGIMNVHKQ
jgi:hypothetical protein